MAIAPKIATFSRARSMMVRPNSPSIANTSPESPPNVRPLTSKLFNLNELFFFSAPLKAPLRAVFNAALNSTGVCAELPALKEAAFLASKSATVFCNSVTIVVNSADLVSNASETPVLISEIDNGIVCYLNISY